MPSYYCDESSDLDSDSSEHSSDGLIFDPCSSLTSKYDTGELVNTCSGCGRFLAKCCHTHSSICHHTRIVFTDGACLNNGTRRAASGIGIAFGQTGQHYQFAISVHDRIDPGGNRTSQRAELLAALHGLKKVCEEDEEEFLERFGDCSDSTSNALEVVIATDSAYVVKGMTEWLPRWRENGLRKSNGERPSNLDLFLELGAAMTACQYKYSCKVKFWKIDRSYNSIADSLAKHGALRVLAADRGGSSGRP